MEVASPNCLLPVMKIKVFSPYCQEINALWDSGATISLITNPKAELLKLRGVPIQLRVTKVGVEEEFITSKKYDVPLVKTNGERIFIRAYGISKITGNISTTSGDILSSLFQNVNSNDIKRPEGQVDLLIGYDYASLHPMREQSNGNIILLDSEFGKCVAGSHPMVKENICCSIITNRTSVAHLNARV